MQNEPVFTVLLTRAQILELLAETVTSKNDLPEFHEARTTLYRVVRQPQSSTNQESHYGNAQANS